MWASACLNLIYVHHLLYVIDKNVSSDGCAYECLCVDAHMKGHVCVCRTSGIKNMEKCHSYRLHGGQSAYICTSIPIPSIFIHITQNCLSNSWLQGCISSLSPLLIEQLDSCAGPAWTWHGICPVAGIKLITVSHVDLSTDSAGNVAHTIHGKQYHFIFNNISSYFIWYSGLISEYILIFG